jgi:hypothetical protein
MDAMPSGHPGTEIQVELTIVVGVVIIAAGLAWAALQRTGRVPKATGARRYLTYLVTGIGAVTIIAGLMD